MVRGRPGRINLQMASGSGSGGSDRAIKIVAVAAVTAVAAYLGYRAYKKQYPFEDLYNKTKKPAEEPTKPEEAPVENEIGNFMLGFN